MKTATIALSILTLGLVAGLHAQTRPLSTTELYLKVAELEKELADVRAAYDALLKTGQTPRVIRNVPAPAPAPIPPPIVFDDDRTEVNGIVRAKCATEWPTDFKMRAYCEGQQKDAMDKIGARNDAGTMNTPDGKVIRAKCMREWVNDFKMTNYCEEQQLKALETLGRR